MKTRILYVVLSSIFCTAFFGPTAIAGKVYTWKDSEGTVHYSEQPPASGQAKTIKIKTSPPSEDVPPAAGSEQKDEDKKTEQERVKVPTEEPSTLTAAQKAENCEKARKNLTALETRPRVLTTDPKTGEKRALAYEEQVDLIIKSREQIRKYCK